MFVLFSKSCPCIINGLLYIGAITKACTKAMLYDKTAITEAQDNLWRRPL